MTDYTSYSNMPFPTNYGAQGMGMPGPMDNNMAGPQYQQQQQQQIPQNGVCMCAECEYMRWGGNSGHSMMPPAPQHPMQQQQQQSIASQPQSAPMQPRKYRHNPYAPVTVGPNQPQMNSAPPVISPGDALASLVPNVQEFEVYNSNNMMYTPTTQQQMPVAQQQPTGGYTLQEQFSGAVGMICELAVSPRGRSMLQAVIRLRQPEQISAIFSEVATSEENIAHLMLDSNACHVIRALLEVIDAPEASILASPSVMSESLVLQLATTSQHTRRILQSLYERFSMESCCEEITQILGSHAQYLATTQQGCIAIMRVGDNATQTQRNFIHEKLFPSMANLAMDPYGNYVVQHMIERGDSYLVSDAVIAHFLPVFVTLCCNKFASNVMEKVFYSITPASRRTLLDSVLYNTNALHALMHDSYGNFVIQAAIESCNNYAEFRRIAERMRPLVHTSPYGHKIEAKLKSKRMTRGSGIGQLNISNISSSSYSNSSSAYNTVPSTPTSSHPMESPTILPENMDMMYCQGY